LLKNFVLDTNVVLHDSNAIFGFQDNTVVIPIYVIEELDTFKKDLSELGRNARQASRNLDKLRQEGSLIEGVELGTGGRLRVAFTRNKLDPALSSKDSMDNWILATALDTQALEPDIPCVFVTMDTNLRIRAEAAGITSQDYDREHITIEELYRGWNETLVDDSVVDKLYADGPMSVEEVLPRTPGAPPIHEGHYVLLRGRERSSKAILCRCDLAADQLIPLPRMKDGVWGIRARNKEQHFALDALLRDEVRLVTLVGKAGTGKTLLAIAAGLSRTTDAEAYSRLLVSRPIFPMGRDIGYLPGSVEEKLNPWMQPIYDNLELLLNLGRTGGAQPGGQPNRNYQQLMDQGVIQVEPLTYIRGRSIPSQFLIVDEAQNLTPHEVKTIITRAGEGTKVVLTGDPYQIDHPYLDSVNNGLTYVVNRFKEQAIACHVTLDKGERSELAELAANLL
jgi:PhoH-like ATPase